MNKVKNLTPFTVPGASAEDGSVISALKDAHKEFGVKAILVENKKEIERILKEINYRDLRQTR